MTRQESGGLGPVVLSKLGPPVRAGSQGVLNLPWA
jgi:hypothetical protein